MQRPSALEAYNSSLSNAAVLADRKLPVAISTAFEGYVPKTAVLRFEAAVAMVNGLGFDRALASITLEPAASLEHDGPIRKPRSRKSPTSSSSMATRSNTAPTSPTRSSPAA